MRVGAAVGDVTPPLGVELGGYPFGDRSNTGVHDPLVATALFLNDESDGRAVIIATDLFWITRGQADEVRRRVAEASDLPADAVVVTASHTHSAPWMNAIFDSPPITVSDDYIESAMAECTRVALAAIAAAEPAEVGVVFGACGHDEGIGGNRRHPEGGSVDTTVPILAARRPTGELIAVWTAYAMHPTILQADNLLVSADFPLGIRAAMAAAHPGVPLLYSMGTAGDQSPRYYRNGQTFDEVDRYGAILGRAVVETLAQVDFHADLPVAIGHLDASLTMKTYAAPADAAALVDRLRAHHAALVAAKAPYPEVQTANLHLLGAECELDNAVQHAEGRLVSRFDRTAPHSVWALSVGDTAWVFWPGEVFVDFGLAVRAASPYPRTAIVTLANGDLPGYCVTGAALAEGGYEPGNSTLDPVSGDALVETALDLLTDLFSDPEAS